MILRFICTEISVFSFVFLQTTVILFRSSTIPCLVNVCLRATTNQFIYFLTYMPLLTVVGSDCTHCVELTDSCNFFDSLFRSAVCVDCVTY